MDFERIEARVFRLYGEEGFEEAAVWVDELARDHPEHGGKLAFWKACLRSRAGDAEGALEALGDAVDSGHWYSEASFGDEDLALIRDESEFSRIVKTSNMAREQYLAQRRDLVVIEPDGSPAGALVAFHRAAGTPVRSLHHWRTAVEVGWLLAMPWAEHVLESDSHLWLDQDLQNLDAAASRRVGSKALDRLQHDFEFGVDQLVLAGFSQGGAVALMLAVDGTIPASRVLVIGSSLRYMEALDEMSDDRASNLRIHFLAGERERHTDTTRQVAGRLEDEGVAVTVDIRPELGHMFPERFGSELPKLLETLHQ